MASGDGVNSLVVAPQWIGDAVMSEPLLRRLAARGERITVGALPWVAPVYRFMPAVAEVQEWPFAHGRLDWASRRALAQRLTGRFERAYVLPNSLKAALVPWLARIPQRIGYQGEGRPWLLNQRLANPTGRPPMVAFYEALADAQAPRPRPEQGPANPTGPKTAGSPHPEQTRPVLAAPEQAWGAELQRLGLTRTRYSAFAPGAEYGPAKCWPASHYAALATSLIERERQPVVLLGSPKEAALCGAIRETVQTALAPALRSLCVNLAGETTLADALALVAGARRLVSNDSGLMHVAAAFGLEQVAIFGSTSPEHTPPLNPKAQVLWLKEELRLDCMPCFDRECRFGHTRCLTELTAARVLASLSP